MAIFLAKGLSLPENSVALAPMAGVADRSFRKLCVKLGAGLTTGEMASAMAICMSDRKTEELLMVDKEARPAGIQLFGSRPERMAQALEKILSFSPDFVDLNMGCPAPKVANNGAGSALMKDPALAEAIVASLVKKVEELGAKNPAGERLPISVKMRLGFTEPTGALEFAKRMEGAGASFLTVHGRTRAQMYSGQADWKAIGEIVKGVKIPVVGNGDIRSGKDAKQRLEETGCAMVAVGRAARTNPFIFREITHFLKTGEEREKATPEERAEALRFVVSDMVALKGEYIALREGRKLAAWFSSGCRSAASLRREAFGLQTLADLEKFLDHFIQAQTNQ